MINPEDLNVPWYSKSDQYKFSAYLIRRITNLNAAPGREHEYPVMVHYVEAPFGLRNEVMPIAKWLETMQPSKHEQDRKGGITLNSNWRHKKNGTIYTCVDLSAYNTEIWVTYRGPDFREWSKPSESFLEAMERIE